MNKDTFNRIVDDQMQMCRDILQAKDPEYSSDQDRLHNFKQAGYLQQISAREALRGMYAKHIVSIFDMCRERKEYPGAMWDEKITDGINYLLLLRGILQDEIDEKLVDRRGRPIILWNHDASKTLSPADLERIQRELREGIDE